MNELVERLQERIAEKKKELGEADRQLQGAQKWRDTVAQDLAGYERALAAETRRNGNGLFAEEQRADAASSDETPDPNENRTEFVRFLVRANPGITPSRIYLQFQKAGVEFHRNYVYSMLKRLAESGEVESRNGKYFSKEKGSEQVAALE